MANKFFPELDYVLSKMENEIFFYLPEKLSFSNTFSNDLSTNSVFNLLFDNEFNEATITYNFTTEDPKNTNVPKDILVRSQIIPNRELKLGGTDNTASNLFQFNNEDISLLDQYKNHRLGLSVDLSSIIFNDLTATGKSIYNILKYLVDGEFEYDIDIMTEDNIIELLLKIWAQQMRCKQLSEEYSEFIRLQEEV